MEPTVAGSLITTSSDATVPVAPWTAVTLTLSSISNFVSFFNVIKPFSLSTLSIVAPTAETIIPSLSVPALTFFVISSPYWFRTL